MDTLHRTSASSAADRLNAFRHSVEPPDVNRRHGQRKNEVLVGTVVVLVGLLLVSFVVFRPTKNQTVLGTNPSAEPAPVINQSQLLAGEALIALSVQSGHFPPELIIGDVVRIAVTPGLDGNSETRLLSDEATVVGISQEGEVQSEAVITVRAPETILTSVASSGPIHVAKVSGPTQ